jgi:PilZ domain
MIDNDRGSPRRPTSPWSHGGSPSRRTWQKRHPSSSSSARSAIRRRGRRVWSSRTTPPSCNRIGGHEEWTLSGIVRTIEDDSQPRWHISVDGPAERSQRRKAVRARVEVPVQIPWAGSQMVGRTVDLSESGMRALMDGWGVPLDPGTPSQLTLTLDDALIPCTVRSCGRRSAALSG